MKFNQPTVLQTAKLSGLGALLCSLLFGCGTAPERPPAPVEPKPSAPITAPPPAVKGPARYSNARTLEEYKREVANIILEANPNLRFTGPVPPMLRSVTIVKLIINNHGHTDGTSIIRSAGLPEFDQVVMQSIRAASPLPAPRAELLNKQGGVEYTETWLMRDDRRFQLRSASAPQVYGSR